MEVVLIAIVILLVVALAVAGWLLLRARRSRVLREQFGTEYTQTVAELGGRRRAEAELEQRRERVEQLHIVPLSLEAAAAFPQRWRDTQSRFVDDPSGAIRDADQFVSEVMAARGYPVAEFEQRAADISVDHAGVVMDYRAAREIALANQRGEADTEDLRRAMVHYRALFDDLLGEGAPVLENREEKE